MADPEQREVFFMEMIHQRTHIACLQETRTSDNIWKDEITENGGVLYCIGAKTSNVHRRYGQGFYVSKEWNRHYYGHEYISDRISVIHFRLNRDGTRRSFLHIINVYAPTSMLARADETELSTFYEDLSRTFQKYHRGMVLIVGDFNSKIGLKQHEEETFVGNFGKGTRNTNGHIMADFLMEHDLYLANTHFAHDMRHRTTWEKNKSILGKTIYNQIDYIAIPRRYKHLLVDSRSRQLKGFDSDHRPVHAIFNFSNWYKQSRLRPQNNSPKYDLAELALNTELRARYNVILQQELESIDPSKPNEEFDTAISHAIHRTIQATIPEAPEKINNHIKYRHDPLLNDLAAVKSKIQQSNPTIIDTGPNSNGKRIS